MTYRNNLIRRMHPASFDIVDRLINMLTTTIELRRMNMNNQRLSRWCCILLTTLGPIAM